MGTLRRMEQQTNIVKFKDGDFPLPEWQMEMVAGLDTEGMTHDAFVTMVNSSMLRNATSFGLQQHMAGSVLQRTLLRRRK